jgi:metallo-beta-lactamase class B
MLEPTDPQAGSLPAYAPIRVDRVMRDGDELAIGPLRLTMHATPGHALGSTSWTWQSCDGDNCPTVAYVDSITAVSADAYRFSDHPDYVATFRRSLDKIAEIECDFLITPHPSVSQLYERLAGDAPLFDDDACRHYATWGREQLDARLAREGSGQ